MTVKQTGKKLFPIENVNEKILTVVVGVNFGDVKNKVYHAIYQNQNSSNQMTTIGEQITAIKYPLPRTAEKCHHFRFFPQKTKITVLWSKKPVISFFDDFPQKI